MATNHDPVPVPPKEDMNPNLSPARESTMLQVFGKPGRLTRDCSDPTGEFARRIVTRDVGPFRVQGLDFAVETLHRVLTDARAEIPGVVDEVRTEGMLCVRQRRGNPSRYSNHSWGCAIDLFFGSGGVIAQGTHATHRGNLLLAPFFNKHGWYWGAEFSGDSIDSMHFELAEETILKLGQGSWLELGGASPPPTEGLKSPLLGADPVLAQVARGDRVLRRKDVRQEGVGVLQDALNLLAETVPELRVDLGPGNRSRGIFGPKTEAAVRAFQAAHALGVDGVVGENTLRALDQALLASGAG